MKKQSKPNAKLFMSERAFQAHVEKQVKNVETCIEVNRAVDLEETLLMNPLGLLAVFGFTNSLEEQNLGLFIAGAKLTYQQQFRKFQNLDSNRYMVILCFLHQNFEALKTDLDADRWIKIDCYQWLYSTDAAIHPDLKAQFNEALQALNAMNELDELGITIPMGAQSSATTSTFKI